MFYTTKDCILPNFPSALPHRKQQLPATISYPVCTVISPVAWRRSKLTGE